MIATSIFKRLRLPASTKTVGLAVVVAALFFIGGGVVRVSRLAGDWGEWLALLGIMLQGLAGLLLLWLLWSVGVRLAALIAPTLATEQVSLAPEQPAPKEAKPIQQAMLRLTDLLAGLEPNTQEADIRLMDARQWTETLVSQVLRVVEKIEEMEEQVKNLGEAIEAINSGQRDKVAYAAGKVTDPVIQQLLRSPYIIRRPEFRTDAITLISGEMGTLEQWGRSYSNFVTALFAQLAQVRDRAVMLQAGRNMLEASKPVLQIQTSLDEAGTALQLRAQPALRMMARQALPGPASGLLD